MGAGGAWQPIATAPKDGTAILLHAIGADSRPMLAIVCWTDPATMFDSGMPTPVQERCEWVGVMGVRYGVPFTHWMPLPDAPEAA